MRTFLIYIGIALAILIASILVFKPEFSMITGSNTSGRIVGITQGGDIILSDNTVKNINDYISKMQSDLTKAINDEKSARESAVSRLTQTLQPKGDYLTNGTRVAIRSGVTSGCGDGKSKFLVNGCGKMFNVNTQGRNQAISAALMGPNPPQGAHVQDRTWLLQRH